MERVRYMLFLSILFLLVQPFAWPHEKIPEESPRNPVPLSSVGETGQDHSPDAAKNEHGLQTRLSRAIEFAGKWHVVVVHFPIALTLSAVLAELLFIVTSRPLYRDAARFVLVVGAISVMVVVPFGWAAAAFESFSGEESRVLFFHRWVGTVAGILVLVTAVASELAARQAKKWFRPADLVLLALSAAAIGITGHLGGMLVHGIDFLNW